MKKKSILLFVSIIALLSFQYVNKANSLNLKENTHENSYTYNNRESKDVASDNQANNILLPAKRNNISEQYLYRKAYTVSYNKKNILPNWVAWILTSSHCSGPYKRSGSKFVEDEDVPSPRATDYDYVRSGYDRGHMCPAGDNKWSEESMQQSFLLTNVCPQNQNLNRGDWNEIENACRSWAEKYGKVYIVCGPIFLNQKHKTIGKNKVTVPEAFFKVVLCMSGKPKAIGFICRNTDGNRPKDAYVNSVDQVERVTGYDFFHKLPNNIENKVEKEANINNW